MKRAVLSGIACLALLFAATPLAHAQESAANGEHQAPATTSQAAPKMMPAKTVDIIIDEKGFNRTEFPARPAVLNNVINLVPGEKIFVEGDLQDNKLTNLRHVDEPRHPERTLEIEFKQNQDRKSPTMILSIKNPFDKTLTYEAGAQYVGKDAILKTSTLPVHPKLTNYESWPQPMTRIFMKRFYLVTAEAAPEPPLPKTPAP